MANNNILVRALIFPSSQDGGDQAHFDFEPIELTLTPEVMVPIGRKVDKKKQTQNHGLLIPQSLVAESSGALVVSSEDQQDDDQDGTDKNNQMLIAFKSKVVSRSHAEIWAGRDGHVYLRDVGSSSGTFLNHFRLCPSGQGSTRYNIKSGDFIQLGVDYQGRTEKVYKSVMFKIFISMISGKRLNIHSTRIKFALRALLAATTPNAKTPDDSWCHECCICLGQLCGFQALFLSPCSHCFHYKCVKRLLLPSGMFQCPTCRQFANLDATIVCDEDEVETNDEHEDDLWTRLKYLEKLNMRPRITTDPDDMDFNDCTLSRVPRDTSQTHQESKNSLNTDTKMEIALTCESKLTLEPANPGNQHTDIGSDPGNSLDRHPQPLNLDIAIDSMNLESAHLGSPGTSVSTNKISFKSPSGPCAPDDINRILSLLMEQSKGISSNFSAKEELFSKLQECVQLLESE